MAKAKKAAAPPQSVPPQAAPVAPAPAQPQQIQVSKDDFIRTRDQVISGLRTLQQAVRDLSIAYIVHTNTVLNNAPGSALDLLNPLVDALNMAPPQQYMAQAPPVAAPQPVAAPVAEEKAKKRKRIKDPNEPKRPLTAYFLYMQKARPIIAQDLGESAPPIEVSNEGTRRWQALPEAEKTKWKEQYQRDYQAYQLKMEEYKKTLPPGALDHLEDEAADQLNGESQAAAEPPKKKKKVAPKAAPENLPNGAPTKVTPISAPTAAEAPAATPAKKAAKKKAPASAAAATTPDASKDKKPRKRAVKEAPAAEPDKKKDDKKKSRRSKAGDAAETAAAT